MPKSILLGLANTVDYEIEWESALYEELIRTYDIRREELSPDISIGNERDLVCSILGHVAQGTGGEHPLPTSGLSEAFASRFSKRSTLGGTPVRAAIAMRKLGLKPMMHLVTVNDTIRRLLPPDCPYVCSGREDASHPHLIVQYEKGMRIRAGDVDLRAHADNRVIYNHNPDLQRLELSAELPEWMARADVLLISGFNAMVDEGLLMERISSLRKAMDALPKGALVFYEDGGFHTPGLQRLVHARLGGRMDVHSVNEDELQTYLQRPVDLRDAGAVSSALREMQEAMPVRTRVVHTQHWALAYGADAARYEEALRAGIRLAGTRYRMGDAYMKEDIHATGKCPPRKEGMRFSRAITEALGESVCCLPSLDVSSEAPTTIGLGDAFAGGFVAALALQGA